MVSDYGIDLLRITFTKQELRTLDRVQPAQDHIGRVADFVRMTAVIRTSRSATSNGSAAMPAWA